MATQRQGASSNHQVYACWAYVSFGLPMRAQILLNILLFYGILIVINIPAGFLGLEFEANEKPRVWYEPPGYVIPIVWFVLFTAMGYAIT